MFGEPCFYLGVFMGGVVVHDQVQLAIRRGLRVDLLKEAQPFLMAMSGLAATQNGPEKGVWPSFVIFRRRF